MMVLVAQVVQILVCVSKQKYSTNQMQNWLSASTVHILLTIPANKTSGLLFRSLASGKSLVEADNSVHSLSIRSRAQVLVNFLLFLQLVIKCFSSNYNSLLLCRPFQQQKKWSIIVGLLQHRQLG